MTAYSPVAASRKRYIVGRLVGEAQIQEARDDDIALLNTLTRAAGLLGETLRGGLEPDVLTKGEPVDGFVAPGKYVEPGPCPQEFVAAMRGDICWADAKALDGTRHQWRAHPRATSAHHERGWHRYICAVCEAEMEVDSSG